MLVHFFLLLYVDEITTSRSNKSRFTKQDEQKASFSKRPLLRKGCTYEYEGVDVRHRRSGHSTQKQCIFCTEGPLLNQFREDVKLLIHW